MAGIKSISGTAPAKQNGLNINLFDQVKANTYISTFSSKDLYLFSKRKNVMTSSANSKHLLQTASKKATIS